MNLGELQCKILTHITGKSLEAYDLSEWILPGGTLLGTNAVLNVYRVGYQARLRCALDSVYRATAAHMGLAIWENVCAAYIAQTPSEEYNLNCYGRTFPEFIADHDFAQEHPYIVELARFERLFAEVYHGQPEATLSPVELSAQLNQNPEAQLRFAPTTVLLYHRYPVYALWRHHRKGEPLPQLGPDQIPSEYLCMYQQDHRVYTQILHPAGFRMLQQLLTGVSFAESLAEGNAAPEVVREFFAWVGRAGIVTSLTW